LLRTKWRLVLLLLLLAILRLASAPGVRAA
jgi:hypothetical protein